MKFEVVSADGNVLFVTEHGECLPSAEQLKEMRHVNYRYRINGKFVDKEKIVSLVEELRSNEH